MMIEEYRATVGGGDERIEIVVTGVPLRDKYGFRDGSTVDLKRTFSSVGEWFGSIDELNEALKSKGCNVDLSLHAHKSAKDAVEALSGAVAGLDPSVLADLSESARLLDEAQARGMKLTEHRRPRCQRYTVEIGEDTLDAYLIKLGPDPDEWHVFVRRDRKGERWRLYYEPDEWIRADIPDGQRITPEDAVDDEEIVRLAVEWYSRQKDGAS